MQNRERDPRMDGMAAKREINGRRDDWNSELEVGRLGPTLWIRIGQFSTNSETLKCHICSLASNMTSEAVFESMVASKQKRKSLRSNGPNKGH